jgi:hypothetical protein
METSQRYHRGLALSIDQQSWPGLGQRNDSQGALGTCARGCDAGRDREACAARPSPRTCARLCHLAGGELDQIRFLPGHVSIQTTERYLGCKQKFREAVNDQMGIEPEGTDD